MRECVNGSNAKQYQLHSMYFFLGFLGSASYNRTLPKSPNVNWGLGGLIQSFSTFRLDVHFLFTANSLLYMASKILSFPSSIHYVMCWNYAMLQATDILRTPCLGNVITLGSTLCRWSDGDGREEDPSQYDLSPSVCLPIEEGLPCILPYSLNKAVALPWFHFHPLSRLDSSPSLGRH